MGPTLVRVERELLIIPRFSPKKHVVLLLSHVHPSVGPSHAFPPWNIRQGDVMTDPSLCTEVFEGVGTPAELERLRAGGGENLYLQHALYLIGGVATGNVILYDWYSLAQKEEEYDRLKSEVAATMEKSKQLRSACLKREPTLRCTNGWRSGPLLQATNSLEKKEATAVAAMEEAIVGCNTAVKALEEANLGRTNAVKALEEANLVYSKLEENACKDLQAHDVTLANVNRRLVEVEAWAAKAEEERDDVVSMNANFVADHTWMRASGVVHVANAILDALENTNAVARAREGGFKVGYIECLTHVNVVSTKKFTDERCALCTVDTEAAMKATIDAYDALVVPTLA
ncbi:hypothetical protein Hanom_Chr09g00801811 [Helianthus anomalus]